MNRSTHSRRTSRQSRSYFWIFEIMIIAAVVPALVAGIDALHKLPVV